jgi:starch-binding outer membrane protein, SusD/RagB family
MTGELNMKKSIVFIYLILTMVFTSCQDFVSNIDPLYDRAVDTDLNTQQNVDVFVTGLQDQLAYTIDDLTCDADGLSDELLYDMRNPQATFSSFQNDDNGTPLDAEEAVVHFRLNHQLRQQADTLIYRILNKITFTDSTIRNRGLYNGYLYASYARYIIAEYTGKDEVTGGSPINMSRFIPSNQILADAINMWKTALTYTTSAYDKKVVYSLMARTYLFMGDYTNAAIYAQQGLAKNDAPMLAKYNATNDNYWRWNAGSTRAQWSVDPRFKAYLTADPTESARIPIVQKTGTGGFIFYVQMKYVLNADNVSEAPIEIIDWQENNLMKAELVVRGAMAGDARALINEVRASRIDATTKLPVSQLASTVTITLSSPVTATSYSIYVERDKELFLRGNRLIDQRRFGLFHLPGRWQYYPISSAEKARNPLWNQ